MKKIIAIIMAATVFIACGDKKNKDVPASDVATTTVTETTTADAAPTGKDAELFQWLSNKSLVSTKKDPKYDMWNNLTLKADGSCTDKDNASAKWSIKDGKFIFSSITKMTMDMEKRAEDTLVFKGVVSDDVYVLKAL